MLALSTDALAIGVMVDPGNAAYRIAARATWLRDATGYAIVRFVAGDVPCARSVLQAEADREGDIVFVASDDCKKWHSAYKTHAWYQYALLAFPRAEWIAKMEDDGMYVPLHQALLLHATHAKAMRMLCYTASPHTPTRSGARSMLAGFGRAPSSARSAP